MAIRVTAAEVTAIIPTSIADATILAEMITTASQFVDDHLADQDLSTRILRSIEQYLAAHFVALTEEGGGLISSEFGDADDKWANVYESGLKSTRFGQAAISMDSSGTLARVASTNMKALFRVV